jgi:hypothetical protein
MFQWDGMGSGKRFQSKSPARTAPAIINKTRIVVARVDIHSPFSIWLLLVYEETGNGNFLCVIQVFHVGVAVLPPAGHERP